LKKIEAISLYLVINKMKTKFLTGEVETPFHKPVKSLTDLIKAHLELGWITKGPMIQSHPTALIWVQRVVKG
jgi:hypothetical protein